MKEIDYKKIIRRYAELGIRLWADGERLRFSLVKDKNANNEMDEEKIAFLKKHKKEILQELNKKEERFLLTDIQSAYLLGRLETFDYGGVSCQIYLEINYEELDKQRCQWCWNQLIKRHEMLRAVICEDGYQIIKNETEEFQVAYYENLQPAELLNIRDRMSDHVFPIGEWPYFAVALSRQEHQTVMHISFDFLIADWNSIWILLKEFEDLYYKKGIKLESTLTFQKYLELENELLASAKGIRDREYWKTRINNLPTCPMLPVKDKQQVERGFDRLVFNLPLKEWSCFCECTQRIGCTPTAAVMAAYAVCLGTWSQTKHFCLNLTLLNRLPIHPEVYQIVGDFTSVSLLEVQLAKGKNFAELIKCVQAQMMEDLDHRLFSGVKVMREYSAVYGKELAIFPYVFTSSIGLVDTEKFTGKIANYGKSSTPQVFIDCQAMDGPDGLRINWDVRKGVFETQILQDMFESFCHFLHSLAQKTENWNNEPPILIPKRQMLVREKINATKKDYKKETLFEIVWRATCKYPNEIAVIDKKEQITYGELKKRIIQIASALREKGCGHGDKIGVLVGKNVNQVTAVLGILAIGGTYVPMDQTQPYQRLKKIVEKAQIKICICEQKSKLAFGEHCQCIDICSLLTEVSNCPDRHSLGGNLEDIAYIIFTSGSTGMPKGVEIANRAVCNTIQDINERFQITKEDKILSLSKLNFDLSVYDIFGILSVGGTVIFPDEEKYLSPSEWYRLLMKYKITIWNTVPTFMTMLIDYCEFENKNLPLRLVLLSGDWIATNLPRQIRKRTSNVIVISLGGATEASIWSNYYVCQEQEDYKNSIPYGYPLSNQGFLIADEFGMPVPDFVPGELCIYGEGLAEGYLEDKQQSEEHFVYNEYLKKRIYRTGDFGYYREDGAIIFLGRRDAQVKIKGHRIELGEIEKTLIKDMQIEDACAVVVERENKSKEILAVVTPAIREETKNEEDFHDILSVCHKQIKNIPNDIEWEFNRDIAALTSMLYGLQKLGIFMPEKIYTTKEIMEAKGIQERYKWFIKYYLFALEKAGYLKREENGWRAKKYISIQELEQAINKIIPKEETEQKAFKQYLANTFKNLYEVLVGEINPVHLLYPKGNDYILEDLYANNEISRIFNNQVADVVANLARRTRHSYRILEIGGGSAATSRCVLKKISNLGLEVIYYFTDVSESFMAKARQHLKEYKNVVFQVFDMDEDFRKQGLRPSFFDAVIATGVIENAKDIKKTLKSIKELLAPGGFLLATEPSREESWILTAQVFMMTPPEDELRREVLYLEDKTWREILEEITWGKLFEFPPSGEKIGNLKLWIKQMNSEYEKPDLQRLEKLAKEYLPEYMVPSQIQVVKQLPLTANGKIDRKEMQKWYVEEDNKEEIKKQNISELDSVELEVIRVITGALGIENIQIERNLYEYGVDSLVQAQIAGKLKNYADEHFTTNKVTFDQILREMLNGTNARELAKFIRKSCEREEKKDTEIFIEEERNSKEDFGELTYLKRGEGTMVVLLPPGLGTLSGISDLAESVVKKTEQPVTALTIKDAQQYCNLDTTKVIDEVANSYAALLNKTNYASFRLVGYCMGGFLALEIARRLTESGKIVEKLIMIDSTPVLELIEDEIIIEFIFLNSFYMEPGKIFTEVEDEQIIAAISYIFESSNQNITENSYQILQKNIQYMSVYVLFEKLKRLTQEERFKVYAKKIARGSNWEETFQMMVEQFSVYIQSFRASKLETEAYFGDILFLKATQDQPYVFLNRENAIQFWKEICIGEVEVKTIPGNHDTCITGENAKKLVDLLLE